MNVVPNNPCGVTYNNTIGRNIFCYYGATADYHFIADSNTAHDYGIGTNKTSFSYIGILV